MSSKTSVSRLSAQRRILHAQLLENHPELEFVSHLRIPVIDSQPGGIDSLIPIATAWLSDSLLVQYTTETCQLQQGRQDQQGR